LANVGIVAAQQAKASRKQSGNFCLDALADLTVP
jgi:hypothetical protein